MPEPAPFLGPHAVAGVRRESRKRRSRHEFGAFRDTVVPVLGAAHHRWLAVSSVRRLMTMTSRSCFTGLASSEKAARGPGVRRRGGGCHAPTTAAACSHCAGVSDRREPRSCSPKTRPKPYESIDTLDHSLASTNYNPRYTSRRWLILITMTIKRSSRISYTTRYAPAARTR